jgi:hypothetical protein
MPTWSPSPITLDAGKRNASKELAAELRRAAEDPALEKVPTFVSTLRAKSELLGAYITAADDLEANGARVVFVAPKGAGKSSVLNGLLRTWTGAVGQLELGEVPSDHLQRLAVLPLGSGGTTPCEVHFEHADDWRVSVEAEAEFSVLQRVNALAGWAYRRAQAPQTAGESIDEGENAIANADAESTQPLPPGPTLQSKLLLEPTPELDVRRCLTGVCGCTPQELLGLARGAIAASHAVEQLRDLLVQRMNYGQRAAFEASPSDGRPPLEWLKDLLDKLTWGRWPNQPFPSRILVRGPAFPRIQGGTQRLCMVDSLGLPAVGRAANEPPLAGRRDLDVLLRSPWAVGVYVAEFMNPPDPVSEALRGALGGSFALMPTHRAIVPLLYKGESILIDALSDEPRSAQKAREAANKQEVASSGINQILRQNGRPEEWSARYSPVIDLMGGLGPGASIFGLEDAIAARLTAMGQAWDSDVAQQLAEANRLKESARTAPEAMEAQLRRFAEHLQPSHAMFRRSLAELVSCPVLPFANACNSRRLGGYLHWATVNSIANHKGVGSRDAFLLLRDDVAEKYIGPAIAAWTTAIHKARGDLNRGAGALEQDMVDQAASSELDRAAKLAQVVPVAFEAAFRDVANRHAGTPQCLWNGGSDSILEIRGDKRLRPLGPHWSAGIKAWGERHQAELWAEVQRHLEQHDVHLPAP